MKMRIIKYLLPVALFVSASVAHATVFRVFPGESIQDAIDVAAPGDTILVEPGEYRENVGGTYGLHITTDNLRLIGKERKGRGGVSKVRILPSDDGQVDRGTGVFAAPPGCEYSDSECDGQLKGFYIRGFSVEGFGKNGIQTRWVDGFKFVRNESINNLNNGIYPTLSANGLVRDNTSYGSLDTAMWVAGSENVRVVRNKLHGSVIGFEITVSNDVLVAHNQIFDNTVGIGLFHPNAAGNPPLPVMANWKIAHNNVYDNNRPNEAPPGTFQADLPQGIGILLLGVSDNLIAKNNVSDNDFVGIGILGWCTGVSTFPARNCANDPPITPEAAKNNRVARNQLENNGTNGSGALSFLAADLVFFDLFGDSTGNCFQWNQPADATFVSSSGALPTDGCVLPQ